MDRRGLILNCSAKKRKWEGLLRFFKADTGCCISLKVAKGRMLFFS